MHNVIGRTLHKKKVSSYLMFHSFFVHESLVLEGADEKNV